MPGFSRGLQLSIESGVIPIKIPRDPCAVGPAEPRPRHAVILTPGWLCVVLGGFYGTGKDLCVHLGHGDGVGGVT